VDALLRRFFRSELPLHWPRPKPSSDLEQTRRVRGVTGWSRIAAAAAVVLFVAGYLMLSSRFPAEQKDGAMELSGSGIGSAGPHTLRPHRHATPSGQTLEKTRNGGEALLQWEQQPGGLFMRIEERRPPRR
jgi:hypothetical protein